MNEAEIFALIRAQLIEIVPEAADVEITLDHSMRDLGANSIDRMDVVITVQDELGIKVPNAELTRANDLRSLVELFSAHASAHA
ncbi:Polyketide biosynthesis acyl-carrier-protein AcpK [Streptomyces sp. YIM 130001]|uniref:phosphopantetheine-binding protein n=1 Tax=Streptomyces sp. YIM 130001 TaxID=2259644 RepID=UPI000E657DD1|nr:phosphopantetheine-binding protein [Streptomyces sp. YIM 130001]RII13440.1 Polyketide biosynthesis acyl-carrier-protein AcpK [Streptomyces sp. YIM 130001]